MKLPRDLQPHFPHAALLILSDAITARFYLIGGDAIEELDGIAEPREFRQDSEGSFTSYDGSRVAGPDSDIDDAPRLKHFVRDVAHSLTDLVRKHDIAHIHLIMPSDVEHLLTKDLPNDMKEKIIHVLHKNLMKEDLLSILRRIYPKK